MYAHSQSLNVPNHFTTADEDPSPCAGGGGGESAADNPHVSYETHSLDDGVGIDDVHIVPSDVVYADGASDLPLQRTDCSNQLTLSFRGQVFVFDDVTTDKVQAVLLLLGASELSSAMQGRELPYENQRESMEYPVGCSLPQRAASLSRFRQKRKERCFIRKLDIMSAKKLHSGCNVRRASSLLPRSVRSLLATILVRIQDKMIAHQKLYALIVALVQSPLQ